MNNNLEGIDKIKPNPITNVQVIGSSGIERYGGYIYEEFLTTLQGNKYLKVFKEMSSNDATVGAILFIFEQMIRKVSWKVKAFSSKREDKKAATFVDECRNDMSHTWFDFITEVLSMFVYGWEWNEICYKYRKGQNRNPDTDSKYIDNRIGWSKLPRRMQTSWNRWVYDDSDPDKLLGMEQIAANVNKPVVIPWEKSLHFRTKPMGGNPEGVSLLRTGWRCVSDDTEILTKNGWINISKLKEKDLIYTLNPETDVIEIQPVLKMNKYLYDGEMILAESRFVNQLVTPNHRMWVRKYWEDKSEFIEADKCLKTYNFKSNGINNVKGKDTIIIDNYEIPINIWARFLGLWLSEGHSWKAKITGNNPNKREVGVTQKEGYFADKIRNILKQLPWKFNENLKDKNRDTSMLYWVCSKTGLYDHLGPLGKALTKRVPKYVFDWSSEQIKLLLRYYHLGDGSIIGTRGWGKYKDYNGTNVIFTSSKGMADDLSQLIFLSGGRPSIRMHSHQGKKGGRFSDNELYIVTIGKNFSGRMMAKWSKEKYGGYVYCPTTENGIIYIRREGKCTWTGNSWFFKKHWEEIEGIGGERDLAGLPVIITPDGINIFDDDPENVKLRLVLEKLISNIRRDKNEGALLPYGYELKLLSTGGTRAFDTNAIINRYDQRIAMSMLSDLIMLGADKSGSFALADVKKSLLAAALEAQLANIADIINKFAIPRLIRLNTFDVTNFPTIESGEIETPDMVELADAISKFSELGYTFFPDEKLEEYIWDNLNLPKVEKMNKTPTPLTEQQQQNQPTQPVEPTKPDGTAPQTPRERAPHQTDDKQKFNETYERNGLKKIVDAINRLGRNKGGKK